MCRIATTTQRTTQTVVSNFSYLLCSDMCYVAIRCQQAILQLYVEVVFHPHRAHGFSRCHHSPFCLTTLILWNLRSGRCGCYEGNARVDARTLLGPTHQIGSQPCPKQMAQVVGPCTSRKSPDIAAQRKQAYAQVYAALYSESLHCSELLFSTAYLPDKNDTQVHQACLFHHQGRHSRETMCKSLGDSQTVEIPIVLLKTGNTFVCTWQVGPLTVVYQGKSKLKLQQIARETAIVYLKLPEERAGSLDIPASAAASLEINSLGALCRARDAVWCTAQCLQLAVRN